MRNSLTSRSPSVKRRIVYAALAASVAAFVTTAASAGCGGGGGGHPTAPANPSSQTKFMPRADSQRLAELAHKFSNDLEQFEKAQKSNNEAKMVEAAKALGQDVTNAEKLTTQYEAKGYGGDPVYVIDKEALADDAATANSKLGSGVSIWK